MRVLISAYACEPASGSEPGIGWNWVQQVARQHDVTVLTRANNRGRIEAAPDRPEAHFVYLDVEWALRFKRGPRGARAYYLLWQLAVARAARELHEAQPFDVVHHLTWTMATLPIGLARHPAPKVLGPVGGGVPPLWRLVVGSPPRAVAYEVLRSLNQRVARWNPLTQRSLNAADVLLVQNRETLQWLRPDLRGRARVESYVGVSADSVQLRTDDRGFPLAPRALFVGRLVAWKGPDWAVRALAAPAGRDITLTVIGDGPMLERCRRLAADLGVASRVRFTGRLDEEGVRREMEMADVLLFPSQHDEGGFVVTEAMASGLRVVCLAAGGPAALAGPAALSVPVRSRSRLAQDLAAAVHAALEIPSRQVFAQAHRYDWSGKAAVATAAYDEAIRRTGPR